MRCNLGGKYTKFSFIYQFSSRLFCIIRNMLNTEFGLNRMGVVGGGHINVAFLEAGLLDELSVMVERMGDTVWLRRY